MAVTLEELTDGSREAVLAMRVAPEQERFVGSVRSALAEAAQYPQARPWYRAVCAGGEPVGFMMVSWNTELVRAAGATELLTSYVLGDGGPAGFYERLGFAPTGELDGNGEVIMALAPH